MGRNYGSNSPVLLGSQKKSSGATATSSAGALIFAEPAKLSAREMQFLGMVMNKNFKVSSIPDVRRDHRHSLLEANEKAKNNHPVTSRHRLSPSPGPIIKPVDAVKNGEDQISYRG